MKRSKETNKYIPLQQELVFETEFGSSTAARWPDCQSGAQILLFQKRRYKKEAEINRQISPEAKLSDCG
jgi:hypothetical protein